jgi:hypothetical protein
LWVVHFFVYFYVTVNNMNEVNARIRNALWSVLSEIADEVDVQSPRDQTDIFRTHIRVGRAVHSANVLWAAEGWPEDVSRVLEHAAKHKPESLVIAARHLSPGALERIARMGIGWVDETGAARIVLSSGLAIYTVGQRPLPQPRPAFAWTPAAIAVGEALLTVPDVNVRSLSATTGVSIGRISRILQAFDREGFTHKRPAEGQIHIARALADRESLLRSWLPAAGNQRRSRWMLTRAGQDPLDFFTEELAPLLGPLGTWALTGPAAAQFEAPYLTTVPSVHVYVDATFPERLQHVQRNGGLTAVDQGGRFEFWSATPTTLRLSRPPRTQPHSGILIADLPRVYADLLALGGRYEEAGGHLREVTNLGW